jgi:tRNA (guanine37-N1)-methyltransferase
MRIDVVTIFPDYLAPLDLSLIGKARASGILDVRVHDLRHWAHDPHRSVDDTPYGGGPGMVMRPEPWHEALEELISQDQTPETLLVVPTPSGRPFTQRDAHDYARRSRLVFACGRYEGIDARVIDEARSRMHVDEVSIGDYVLGGGEAATLVIIEATARLLPGVLGNTGSLSDDSFGPGSMAWLLEGPVYTKPAVWRGRDVPAVLLSGHHAEIARWRRDQALRRTARYRPELFERLDPAALDDQDRDVLRSVGFRMNANGMAD